MQSKNFIRPALITALVLLIPLAAMQFKSDVNWDETDFIVMGTLIFGAGFMVELAIRKIKNKNHRIIAVVAIMAALLWLWVELAVGLFTNWGS